MRAPENCSRRSLIVSPRLSRIRSQVPRDRSVSLNYRRRPFRRCILSRLRRSLRPITQFRRAGRKTRSPISAATMAEQASPPKKEIPGIELKVAARKALEITAVVIRRATPTVRKDRSIARRTSAPSRRSRINRIRKWMVSSTAIPRQMLKVRTLLIWRGLSR